MAETGGSRASSLADLNSIEDVQCWKESTSIVAKNIKFMFSKKATKIDKIFTVDLTLYSKHQIDSEDFVNFHGLLRKCER